jgi:cold shock protein
MDTLRVMHSVEQLLMSNCDTVKARLKWFNSPKGFGFVVPENDDTMDAFLHVTTLKKAGVDAIGEGAFLLCRIEQGPKGAQVKEIIAMLDAGSEPEAVATAKLPQSQGRGRAAEVTRVIGTVKWYKTEKGFGFVVPEDGGKDIFLHKKCLERHGLDSVEPRTWLEMDVRMSVRGREVVDFRFLED